MFAITSIQNKKVIVGFTMPNSIDSPKENDSGFPWLRKEKLLLASLHNCF